MCSNLKVKLLGVLFPFFIKFLISFLIYKMASVDEQKQCVQGSLCVLRVIRYEVREPLGFACYHLDPCCSVLRQPHMPGNWACSATLLRLGFWVLCGCPLPVTIAQILHLPCPNASSLWVHQSSPHFLHNHTGIHGNFWIHIHQKCFLKAHPSNYVLLPFTLYCGYSKWARDTLYYRQEVGHKSSQLSP